MFSISGFLPFLPPSKNSFREKVLHFLHQCLRFPVFSDSFRCRTGCRKHKKGVGKGEGGKPDKVMRWQAENVRGRPEEEGRRLQHQWLISDILHQAQEVYLVFSEMRNRHRISLKNRFSLPSQPLPHSVLQRFAEGFLTLAEEKTKTLHTFGKTKTAEIGKKAAVMFASSEFSCKFARTKTTTNT